MTILVSRLDELESAHCPACESLLERHQPDPDQPGRLLATCGKCSEWFLIDEDAGIIAQLPAAKQLRSLQFKAKRPRLPRA
jgi:hypothetical protein